MPSNETNEPDSVCTDVAPATLFRKAEHLLDSDLAAFRSSFAELCQNRTDAAERHHRVFAEELTLGVQQFDAYCRNQTDELRQHIREQDDAVEAKQRQLRRERETHLQSAVQKVLDIICRSQTALGVRVSGDAEPDADLDPLQAATFNAFMTLLHEDAAPDGAVSSPRHK
jgi:uncharacterized protein YeaO (DUF488 family)